MCDYWHIISPVSTVSQGLEGHEACGKWRAILYILYVFIRSLKFYFKQRILYRLSPTFKRTGISIKCCVTTVISSVRKINISQQSTVSAFNKYIKEKLVVNQLCKVIHSIVHEIVIFTSLLSLRQFRLSYNHSQKQHKICSWRICFSLSYFIFKYLDLKIHPILNVFTNKDCYWF